MVLYFLNESRFSIVHWALTYQFCFSNTFLLLFLNALSIIVSIKDSCNYLCNYIVHIAQYNNARITQIVTSQLIILQRASVRDYTHLSFLQLMWDIVSLVVSAIVKRLIWLDCSLIRSQHLLTANVSVWYILGVVVRVAGERGLGSNVNIVRARLGDWIHIPLTVVNWNIIFIWFYVHLSHGEWFYLRYKWVISNNQSNSL